MLSVVFIDSCMVFIDFSTVFIVFTWCSLFFHCFHLSFNGFYCFFHCVHWFLDGFDLYNHAGIMNIVDRVDLVDSWLASIPMNMYMQRSMVFHRQLVSNGFASHQEVPPSKDVSEVWCGCVARYIQGLKVVGGRSPDPVPTKWGMMIHNDMYGWMDGWLAVCLSVQYVCMHAWMDGWDGCNGCNVMQCYVMLCNVMQCYATLWNGM